jgi:aryl-alcohol dehydrogenase-like predicted oxidoreductase
MKLCLGSANLYNKYGLSYKNNTKKKHNFLSKKYKKRFNFIDLSNGYKNLNKLKDKMNLFDNVIYKISFKNIKINKTELNKKRVELIKFKKNAKIDIFYAVILHNAELMYSKNCQVLYEFFLNLKKEKICKKIGISSYSEKDFKLFKKFDYDIIQFPVNVFDQRILKKKNLNYIKKLKIEVHARSIFLQGLLLNYTYESSYFSKFKEIKKFKKFLLDNKLRNLYTCLDFIYQIKFIRLVVIGIDNLNQMNEIEKELLIIKKNNLSINSQDYRKLKTSNQRLIDPRKWN